VLETYFGIPFVAGQPITYSPNPDDVQTPSIVLGDGTLKPADETYSIFTVSDINPKIGAHIDTPFPEIKVRFSKDIDADKINGQAIHIVQGQSKAFVYCSISYDEDTRTVTLVPYAPLQPNNIYYMNIYFEEVAFLDDEPDEFEFNAFFRTGSF